MHPLTLIKDNANQLSQEHHAKDDVAIVNTMKQS